MATPEQGNHDQTTPEQASFQEVPLPAASFHEALEELLSRAPGPVFPRARKLYLQKYPIGGNSNAPFRTFLLEEDIQEAAGGVVRIRALAFAVVHWQAAQVAVDLYADHLRQRWGLEPDDLTLVPEEPWFRDGGAWARFSHPLVCERATPTTLINP